MAFFGITSRNESQKRAMQVLMNDKPYVFLTGPAGTGKSLIAQAVGLEHTIEERKYRKLVYTRLQAQLGMDVGALPGDINEKTYPFIRPFLDNLEVMSDSAKQMIAYFMSGDKSKIYFDPIQTMRGGTFHQSYVIVDEVQNLDVATMHGVATRLGENTKMIFCGNFAQIDNVKLRDHRRNGLYQLLNGLYEAGRHEYFDHVNLAEVVRHPAIQVVEEILRNHEMAAEFEALEARGSVEAVT
ncbi:PhoH family protein [Fictibacillus sp. Mic-4]|uniref:PhoH family protein n=1 Tax=Fictibacillus sp. Mic-4 TaxID=3132826 RepID=UPI003CE90768